MFSWRMPHIYWILKWLMQKCFAIMFNFNFCLSFSLFGIFILLRKIEWNPKTHKSFHFTQSSELNFFKLDLLLPLARSCKCSWLCIMRTWKAKKEQYIDSILKMIFIFLWVMFHCKCLTILLDIMFLLSIFKFSAKFVCLLKTLFIGS